MIQEDYERLSRISGDELSGAVSDSEQDITIELVFANAVESDVVAKQISAGLVGAAVNVSPVFEAQADRFHFVEFGGMRADGQEARVFTFARSLRELTGAAEANPVLSDSLYGAMAVGAAREESFIKICETDRNNDLSFGWVHPVIKTPKAWASHNRGEGSLIAVIDTGYSSHQELYEIIRHDGELNLVEGGTDARDRFSSGFMKNPGHGTLVSSVVASRGSADMQGNVVGKGGITGSAPEACILPIRAIKSVVNFRQKTIPKAVVHAINHGADVITMAMGGPTRVASTERALRLAVREGVVVTCAAGNCWRSVIFPAAYAASGLCTAVAALTNTLAPWKMSGQGVSVTVSAPGENVWGAAKNRADDIDHGIKTAQGTTLATSLTAGVAALWVARHGGRAVLKQKADAAGTTVQAMFVHCITKGISKPPVWNDSNTLGAGVLDAEKALNTPLPTSRTESTAQDEDQLPATGVETPANLFMQHLADRDTGAAAEFGADLVEYSSELLWLSHRAGAKARAIENGANEGVAASGVSSDTASPALALLLEGKPALQALIQR